MTPAAIEASGELAQLLAGGDDEARRAALLALLPGLHADVPEHVYHARVLGVASKSTLDLVHQSPAHYRAWLDGAEREPTPAMVLGTAIHTAVLEPHRRRAVGGGKRGAPQAAIVDGVARAVRAHALAGRMLERGAAEITVRWDDADTGLACKSRLDWYDADRGLVVDLKSTSDASPREFARSIANFRYHVQAAMYLAGLRALGERAEHFVFVAVEKSAPYAVATYVLDEAALLVGERAMRRDLRTLADCCARDEWPAYTETITTLELPRWAEE